MDNETGRGLTAKPLTMALRYLVLTLSCLLAFGGYLVFDLCATLQDPIMEQLGISNTQYSLLYVVYAWTNCLMVLFAGVLIDKTTNRMCALIFCAIACVGQTVLTIGAQVGVFPLMVIGRTIFGAGLGSICVAQNTLTNTYFRDVNLATAFAATLTVSRVGSVTNFLLSPYLYQWWGSIAAVFWYGTGMTLLSLISAVFLFFVDRDTERKGKIQSANRRSRQIKWRDVLQFPAIFWVICLICSFYYINVFAMMAVLPDFLVRVALPHALPGTVLVSKKGMLQPTASMISSSVLLRHSLRSILRPHHRLSGIPFAHTSHRCGSDVKTLFTSGKVMIPFDIALGYTSWNPIPFLVICGASYSMVASTLWPSLCLVVRDETMGSANGIATSIQMIGIGCSNLIVGALRDHFTYTQVMLYLACCATMATLMTVVCQFLDYKQQNCFLNVYVAMKKKAAAPAPSGTEKTPLLPDQGPETGVINENKETEDSKQE
eukprot:TRINITY_DN73_c2_g1_i16.p1 TRINITY_DN73_c2_g1~~TRINITY_DN73_c2_g1_i16.p1  ORF type:complete len:526 (+),score=97.54 TRINITY_DN73_c2_g1_i16:112-1578(+)